MTDFTPFPYQAEGADWLHPKRFALLADEMGLGKTLQTIMALDHLSDVEGRPLRVAVICPAVARVNWLREFEKFSRHKREFNLIMKKEQEVYPHQSVICSYDLAAETPKHANINWASLRWRGRFDVLILDEVHFLKSIDAKRTRAILGKEGLIWRSLRTWALSGTPAPNHAGELWTLLYTFGATPLTYDQFVDRYCDTETTAYGPKVIGTHVPRIPELRQVLAPIMLRRRKDEVMKELPPVFYQDIAVEAGEVDIEAQSSFAKYTVNDTARGELKQKLTLEEKMLEQIHSNLDGFGTREGIATMKALSDSVSTLRMYTGLQKVKSVAELLRDELDAKAYWKIVVFAVHRDVIEGLRTALEFYHPVTLYGGTPPAKRQANIDKFQDPKSKCRIFIANIQACSTSVNLTAAHNVLFVEQSWVPAENAQAAMRCHRIGQTKPVTVRIAGLAGSIDEKIARALRKKTAQLTKIFDEKEEIDLSKSQSTSNDESHAHKVSGQADDQIQKPSRQFLAAVVDEDAETNGGLDGI